MKELAYERSFREWCEREGIGWERARYPRPAAGGHVLAYRLRPARPPRAALLAVHGAGNDALFSLTGVFRRLLRRDVEVFSFDVDGHGRGSDTRFSPQAAADCIPDALRHWGAAERGLPVHALGVSLGGSLLLHSLPALSPTLASAVLMVAPLRIHLSARSMLNELGAPLLRTLWRERANFGLTGLIPSFGPFKRDLYPLRLGVPPGPGPFGYVEVLNRTLEALRLEAAARTADLPVLLVYGAADRLVPPEQGRELERLLPRAELRILQGETHLSTPLAPAAVEAALAWIAEHSPARASLRTGPAEGGR